MPPDPLIPGLQPRSEHRPASTAPTTWSPRRSSTCPGSRCTAAPTSSTGCRSATSSPGRSSSSWRRCRPGRRLGADHPVPRRRLLRHRHRDDRRPRMRRLHRDRPGRPVERRHRDPRRSTASTPTSPGTTTAPRTSPSPGYPAHPHPAGARSTWPPAQALERAALAVVGHRPLQSPEGPHLYHRGDHWYLLIAEGGTDRGHAVEHRPWPLPRRSVRGQPGQPGPDRARHRNPVQNLGHADLVETPDGGTAMVLLGVRPVGFGPAFSPLGRETFLTPVRWVDGWPQADRCCWPRARPRTRTLRPRRPGALDDPGWLAVRRTPAEVAGGRAGRLVDHRPDRAGRPPPVVRRPPAAAPDR